MTIEEYNKMLPGNLYKVYCKNTMYLYKHFDIDKLCIEKPVLMYVGLSEDNTSYFRFLYKKDLLDVFDGDIIFEEVK